MEADAQQHTAAQSYPLSATLSSPYISEMSDFLSKDGEELESSFSPRDMLLYQEGIVLLSKTHDGLLKKLQASGISVPRENIKTHKMAEANKAFSHFH